MPLVLTTPPTAEPIALAEAASHIRQDSSDDDSLVRNLIRTARQHVEQITRRQLIAATYTLYRDAFAPVIRLPRPPVISVDSISYVDTSGETQTVASGVYYADTGPTVPAVREAYGQSWPATRGYRNDVRVTYTAGYAAPFTADASTDTCTVSGRTLSDGDVVRLSNSGGDLPLGLSTDTDYYVRDVSGQTFKLTTSAGGEAIDIGSSGTGTHFVGVVPGPLRQALLLLIGPWYENREAVLVGTVARALPAAVEALLWPYRVWVEI